MAPISGMAEERIQLKIAVLPWKINSTEKLDYVRDALYDMMSSRMAIEKNIIILKESLVRNVFSRYANEKVTDDLLKKIGNELGADYVLHGSLTVIADTVSIDAKVVNTRRDEPPIQSTSQGKGLESIVLITSHLALDLNAKILEREGLEVTVAGFGAAPTYTGGFTRKDESKKAVEQDDFIITTRDKSREKQLWRSQSFSKDMKRMAVGDIDGDGRNEVILIDEHSLYIYRVRGQVMDLVREFKGAIYEFNYAVDVIDLNGNNIPEIYVSRITNKKVDSFVIEYQSGEFVKTIKNLPWFFSTAGGYDKDNVLLIQRFSDGVFFREIKNIAWKEGKLVEGAKIDTPEGSNIYNFVKLSFGEDRSEHVLAYTDKDNLKLYTKDDKGKWLDVWTSKDYFGGSLNRIHLQDFSGGITGPPEPMGFVDIKSRILYGDLDGDGNIEVVVNKNEPGTLSRYFARIDSYKRGEVVDLSWEKGSFEENWKTRKVDGYIADFQIKDIDNDGQKELVMLIVEGSAMSTAKTSYLIAYKLNIR